jgi:co-chaperonin GroES (HSP10)
MRAPHNKFKLHLRTMSNDEDNDAKSKMPAVRGQTQLMGRISRRIRKISPLGMRVVVRIEKEQNVTETGLYLPEGAKQEQAESVLAEVMEVASAADVHSDDETNISGIPLGARVLIPKNAGVKIPWDDNYRIVDSQDVLAIVDEINLT